MSDSEWAPPPKRRTSRSGWIVALIVTSGSIIGQLLQVRAGDARELTRISASLTLEDKIDKLGDKMQVLSERITVIETERKQEAIAAAAPAQIVKPSRKYRTTGEP